MSEGPHRRYNPLADKWVLVSPHRILRPWQGEEQEPELVPLAHDPDCYLCPGNTRVTGEKNPNFAGVHLFPNDLNFKYYKKEISAVKRNDFNSRRKRRWISFDHCQDQEVGQS